VCRFGEKLGAAELSQPVCDVRMHGVLLELRVLLRLEASSRQSRRTSVPTTDPATESTTEQGSPCRPSWTSQRRR